MAREVNAERGLGRRSGVVVALVVLLGALGTGLAATTLHVSAHRAAERAFAQEQDTVAKVITAEIIQYGLALSDLSAAVGAQSVLWAEEFAAMTATINSQRLPGATEINYFVPATTADVPALQAHWRGRGSSGLTLDPEPGDGRHAFAVLGRALDGGTLRLGSDSRATPEVAAALQAARSSGMVATGHTFRPAGGGELSFVMAAPVYATSPPSQAGQFRGWITMTFRGSDFLGQTVGVIAGESVSVEFADLVDGTAVPIATWRPAARLDDSIPARTMVLPFPKDQWSLTVAATERLRPAAEAWLPRIAVGVGGLLTLLLAALTAAVVTSRDRALRRVDEATAELRHDITRREAVEQQLRRREEELVAFAGVVAHDLRSPLMSVLGYSDLLAEDDGENLTERQINYLSRVRGSATRMRGLIDDLLAYAMAESNSLRTMEIKLGEVVDSVLAERLGSAPIEPAPRVDHGELPMVLGDPTLVRQILDNLIGNALKYTPAGRAAEITVSATVVDGAARIEVADHGIGIPDEQRATVFDAFTRAGGSERYPGTGLGLAIVQRIVTRHGGTVGVDANDGGGSRFWFTLPTPRG
ncbi:sensor histidine kinase [Paractinoplanes ferrugineus]|uniref:sensor histidine kinase n=1 Tax=Paractinoplanes ferrugineus TaxID=113564 RepID=UPI001942CEC4|nr:ATP-binding protein [Actinoplanes ferrugineus]